MTAVFSPMQAAVTGRLLLPSLPEPEPGPVPVPLPVFGVERWEATDAGRAVDRGALSAGLSSVPVPVSVGRDCPPVVPAPGAAAPAVPSSPLQAVSERAARRAVAAKAVVAHGCGTPRGCSVVSVVADQDHDDRAGDDHYAHGHGIDQLDAEASSQGVIPVVPAVRSQTARWRIPVATPARPLGMPECLRVL
ncbi:hypothetical protein ACWGF2_22190 [Streptomyces sp. NPDC054919]